MEVDDRASRTIFGGAESGTAKYKEIAISNEEAVSKIVYLKNFYLVITPQARIGGRLGRLHQTVEDCQKIRLYQNFINISHSKCTQNEETIGNGLYR